MPQLPLNTLTSHPVAKTVDHTVTLVRAAVFGVSVLAAIPTAHNLFYSYMHGIPYAQVPHRLAQYDLWMKNLDCKVEYRQILTQSGTKVDVGACPSSKDIAIKLTTQAGSSSYEWIAFNDLQKPVVTSALLGLFVTPAMAEGSPATAQPPAPAAPAVKVAQAGMQVMCQVKGAGDKLIRIVQDGGKCFRETLNIMKGSLEKREEVACTTKCQ